MRRSKATLVVGGRVLGQLERLRDQFGPEPAARKRALWRLVARSSFASARQLERLHEALCHARAYPDDAAVLAIVERLLRSFERRADLQALRERLSNTGIAGTSTIYQLFWPTANWFARHWPDRIELDRNDEEVAERLGDALPLLTSPAEAAALREARLPGFTAIDRLRGTASSDATFLVQNIAVLPGDTFTREAFHDRIDAAYVMQLGGDAPSRTLAKFAKSPVVFQLAAPHRGRPDLRMEAERAPREIRRVSVRDGATLIGLARSAMVARDRDLDAFAYGNPRDVWFVDDGDGLAFAINGVLPERRTLLPGIFGGLTLRNGVPIGYTQFDVIGVSCALSFNTFPTFRGGEAAHTLGRLLAMAKALFGARSFTVEPYQLGQGNYEGIASGAWWFYYKLGFRPRAAGVRRLVREELQRMAKNSRYRSPPSRLEALATQHLFFELDAASPTPLPPLAHIGFRVAADLARLNAHDRAQALQQASDRALRLTGQRSTAGWTRDERTAWLRWCPLVEAVPGLARWRLADRRALAAVIRAKGAASELDFVRRFASHPKLARALGCV